MHIGEKILSHNSNALEPKHFLLSSQFNVDNHLLFKKSLKSNIHQKIFANGIRSLNLTH
jgi:hypothetical protein